MSKSIATKSKITVDIFYCLQIYLAKHLQKHYLIATEYFYLNHVI